MRKKTLNAPRRVVAAHLQYQKWDFNRRWMMKEERSKQITAAATALTSGLWQHGLTPSAPATKEGNSCFFRSNADDEPSVLALTAAPCQNTIRVVVESICIHVVSPHGGNVSTIYSREEIRCQLKVHCAVKNQVRALVCGFPDVKELKLELKLLASITGKWLNPHICGRSPLFVAYHHFLWRICHPSSPLSGGCQSLAYHRDWRGAENHIDGGLKAAECKVAVNKSSGGFRDLPFAAAAEYKAQTLQCCFFLFCFLPGLSLVSWGKKTINIHIARGPNSPCGKVFCV